MTQQNSHVFFPRDDRPIADYGEGVYIYDENGNRYLDAIGGTHVNGIGYGVQEVADAMAEQAKKLNFVHKVAFTSDAQEQLADKVIAMAPEGMTKVTFVTGGSLGVEMAVQIARYYHLAKGNDGKVKVIGRWHGYHGRTMTALALSGSLFVQGDKMAHYAAHTPRIQAPHCYKCPLKLQYPSCQLACADELERTILQEGAHTVSAFIAEPVGGGANSAITPPAGYYERIREICDKYDVLFISEEVITGFGRTGKPFGIQHWDCVPDMIIGTKGLSSGYAPIGAVIVHGRIWDTFIETNTMGIPAWVTYSGHPISCAAALAVQNYIEEHNLIERCAAMGDYLRSELEELAKREPIIGDIRGKGLQIGIEFVQDRETRQSFPRSYKLIENIIATAFNNGMIIRGRPGDGVTKEGDHMLLSPPFIITHEQCDTLVAILAKTIQEVKEKLNLTPPHHLNGRGRVGVMV